MQDSLQTSIPTATAKVTADTIQTLPAQPIKRKLLPVSASDSGFKKSLETNPAVSFKAIQQEHSISAASLENTSPINFFEGHELKVIHNGPQLLNRHSPDWIFPILVLVFASFAWLRTYYNKYVIQIMSAFWNSNLTNQIVRDESILVQRASVVMNVLFNLVAALFLYFISIHYEWSLGGIGIGINRYLFFALIVSAAYAVKFLVLKICGYLFDINREMSTYLFNIFLINNVLCMMLIPLVSFLAFSHFISTAWIMTFSIGLVAVAYIYRIIRGLMIGYTSSSFSPYYLFLYLCTLEFAPLLLLVKILSQK